MSPTSDWHPVLPSHELTSGETIVAGLLHGEELALWRSVDGVAQAWENRCPHRGTRLTLGRILDGKLSCAYHGWEFEADSGACSRIPAQPQQAVPQGVCVKTWRVAEAQGMVWVSAKTLGTPLAAQGADGVFCRSVSVRLGGDAARQALVQGGFVEAAPCVWQGSVAGKPVTLFFTEAKAGWVLLHLFARTADDALAVTRASGRLRAAMEEGDA